MKIITMSALILALSSGAAFADRHGGRGGGGGGGGRAVVHENHGGSWSGGVSVHSTPHVVVHNNGGFREGYRHEGVREGYRGGYQSGYVVRRPIYVRRPIIRERYFDYRYRPRIIVENYAAMDGYYWVSGQWSWDGAEWLWTPGHYEPNASYVEPGYDTSYDGY
jgi:hypothetical protein